MKEVVFVRKNLSKWKAASTLCLSLDTASPDHIADTYLEVSADLAFAQTHYPDSELVTLLNGIALKLHNGIYGRKQQRLRRIYNFWMHEIPVEVWRHRRFMYLSIILFILSSILGAVSTVADPEFAEDFLGNSYVRHTLKNIAEGNPMGVYCQESSSDMFIAITLNNIAVSFYVFIGAMLTSFYVAYQLIRNGIMMGVFFAFCQQHGVLSDCLMSVWQHGVFEITAIIVAGGAALCLGSGWLFPGSLPRLTSFRLAAHNSVKIIVGLVPFFIVAGFIESYLTRHSEAPFPLRLGFIIFCLAIVILYFIYLPYRHRHYVSHY